MRFSTIIVSLLGAAATVFATTLVGRQSGYPSCSIPCLASAPLGNCTMSDTKCLCENPVFVANTTTCITKSCQGDDLQKAESLAVDNCRVVGVTLSSSPTSTPGGSATGPSAVAPTTTKSSASKTNRNTVLGLGAAALAAFCL